MPTSIIKIQDFELNELYKSFPGVITSIKVNLDYTEECLFISDNCETYFGYTADELIKHWDSFLNNINGQDKDYFKTDLKAALKTTKRISSVGRFKTKDNEIKWLKFNANIIDYTTHYILQGVYIDITEEKTRELKEDKLKDSLILLARHSVIYKGDVKSIGKLCTQIIADTLDISRAGFWLYNETNISCDTLFTKSSQQYTSGDILHDKDFVDFFTLLRKEPFVVANDAQNHIYTKELKTTYLNKNNIQSLLFVPIIHNQKIIGVLSQEQTHKQRVWQKLEINFMFQVAELISLCFSLNERNLLEEEQKLKIEELTNMVERLKSQIR
jgi:PAS domain S-box-containing protein